MSLEPTGTAKSATALTLYGTPFAAILIAYGLIVAVPGGPVRNFCAGLIVIGILVNLLMLGLIRGIQRIRQGVIRIRLIFNLACNVLLVYLMSDYWPPIWLLLTLTPVAMAIYGSLAETLGAAFMTCLLLAGVYAAQLSTRILATKPPAALTDLGMHEHIVYCLYMFFLCLAIHKIMNDVRSTSRSNG